MNKTTRKALFAVLAIVILVGWGLIYATFNGNPIKLYMARKPIMDYLSVTYPNTSFTYEKPTYDFKAAAYGGRIRANANPPVNFSVYLRPGGDVYEIFLEEKMRVEMELELKPVLLEIAPELSSVWLKVYWDKDEVTITDDMSYAKDLDVLVSADIRLDGPAVSREAFLRRCLEIDSALREKGFRIQSSIFIYGFGQGETYLLNLAENMHGWTEERLLREISYFGK